MNFMLYELDLNIAIIFKSKIIPEYWCCKGLPRLWSSLLNQRLWPLHLKQVLYMIRYLEAMIFLPLLNKYYPDHTVFWQTLPSNSQVCSNSEWTKESEAYPKIWLLDPLQNYCLKWKKSLVLKRNGKSWN